MVVVGILNVHEIHGTARCGTTRLDDYLIIKSDCNKHNQHISYSFACDGKAVRHKDLKTLGVPTSAIAVHDLPVILLELH